MSIPRFLDQDRGNTPCEIALFCPNCGWAITHDRMTANWKQCILCDGKLVVKKILYLPSGESEVIAVG